MTTTETKPTATLTADETAKRLAVLKAAQTDGWRPPNASVLHTEAMKATAAAISKAADEAAKPTATATAPTSNGAIQPANEATKAPAVLPDLTKQPTPKVDVSAAGKGTAKATTKKGSNKAGDKGAATTNANGNGSNEAAPQFFAPIDLNKWAKWLAPGPTAAHMAWAMTVSKFTGKGGVNKHNVAFAYYHTLGSERANMYDVGQAVALASWGTADNKSNAANQNAQQGRCFVIKGHANPSRNPSNTGGGGGNAGYHCSPYRVNPDGSVEAIEWRYIKAGYQRILGYGLKIPAELLPPAEAKMRPEHDVLTPVPGIKYHNPAR